MYTAADARERDLYQRRLALFTQICYKRINIDFNTISLQLVGSLGLPDNIREILTQLDENDILVFFDAFKLPIPPTSTNEMFSHKSLLIEILVKECTPAAQATSKISELTLFPTEKDLWAWNPFGEDDDNERQQTSYTSL